MRPKYSRLSHSRPSQHRVCCTPVVCGVVFVRKLVFSQVTKITKGGEVLDELQIDEDVSLKPHDLLTTILSWTPDNKPEREAKSEGIWTIDLNQKGRLDVRRVAARKEGGCVWLLNFCQSWRRGLQRRAYVVTRGGYLVVWNAISLLPAAAFALSLKGILGGTNASHVPLQIEYGGKWITQSTFETV